jgi:hypothetical protein
VANTLTINDFGRVPEAGNRLASPIAEDTPHMRHPILPSTVVCAVVLQMLSVAPAAADVVTISSVRHDASAKQLVIRGTGFEKGAQVVLEATFLKVVALGRSELKVELPSVAPGNYRLYVVQRRGPVARFIATVGGSGGGSGVPGPPGPAGPMGPTGPMGPMGLMGPQGVAGPAGAAGAAGAVGPAGPTGPAGAAGARGATGAQGPAGVPGATGPQGPLGLPGPQGPQGLQGLQGPVGPAGAAGLQVLATNGAVLGSLVGFTPGGTSYVALQRDGVWLFAPLGADGIVPMSFNAMHLTADCSDTPYLPLDTNPAPLFRLLQVVNAGDATAHFAGNPTTTQAFVALRQLDGSGPCIPTAGTGWDVPMLAGPRRTLDLTALPGPYRVQ